ncbi:glycosyltransferase [Plesiomonas shigelloides]|uniref:glycosyltransferase n=1 Tax=Plesiomonas shigelloides TaxID=703 RepID=UPI0031B7BE39
MEKNKVDLIIDTLSFGGAERVCVNYANFLADTGYDVRIIVFRKTEKNYAPLLNSNIDVSYLNCKNSIQLIGKIITKRITLQKTVVAFNHQIAIAVHISKTITHKKIRLIARNVNYLSRDLEIRKPSIKKLLTKLTMKLLYKNIDHFIAQCDAMKLDMINYLDVNHEKIDVVYNPVSNNIYKIEGCEKDIDVLFVGRLSPQKGIPFLIRIIKSVLSHNNNTSFTIIGDGPLSSKISHEIEEIQKEYKTNNITYIRETSNINEFYNRSKITILTSLYEGFPNVLAESLKVGTPVISFDCQSGPSEIIRDGVNGYLIPTNDIRLFTEKITDLLYKNIKLTDIKYFNEKNSYAVLTKALANYEIK